MIDPRLLAVILALGAAAIIGKAMDLFRWYVNEEPIVVDSSTNGGVSAHATRR